MMKNFFVFSVLMCTLGLTACDDSEDYTSKAPTFNAFSVTKIKAATGSLDDGVFRVGDVLLAKLVQSQQGHLLNKVTYTWKTDLQAVHKYVSVSVYDADPVSPVDTITVKEKGFYTVTLNAKYNVSGQGGSFTQAYNFSDGGSVSLSGGLLQINMEAMQNFWVEDSL